MAIEKDLELLDDYLANRLSPQEQAAFESKLAGDPELAKEFNLQQQFVEGIKTARVKMLKSMLGNVPVPTANVGASAIVGKIAIGVLVAGLVATGVYITLDKTTEDASQTSVNNTVMEEQPVVTDEQPEQPSETIASATPEKPAETSPDRSRTSAVKNAPTSDAPRVVKPTLEVFDPTSEVNSNEQPLPESENTYSSKAVRSSIVVETDNSSRKYTFHYQFKQDRLLLYGNFDNNLYEIMEFFGENNKRTIFLFYRDNYYLLDESVKDITPLKAIADPKLIKKLKEFSAN